MEVVVEMEYRRMGAAGLKLSVFSLGSWITFGGQMGTDESLACMQAAYEGGVNFFDNAEVYARGESERVMGEALQRLGWPRHSYVISTKFYWGLHDTPNTHWTLNRKYLMEAIDGSLERLGLEHVDLIYCHRPDRNTPIEETVWAMSDIVGSGRAHYWGTSEWSAQEIRAAWEVAERHHLRKPVVEQAKYNLLHRRRVEEEYDRLYEDIGLGLTTFSPLGSGLLSGKYLDGIPDGSRATLEDQVREMVTQPADAAKVREFKAVADEIGCSMSQLALAWAASNRQVSSVITGASRVEQVRENLGALEVLAGLTDEVKTRIETIFA